MVSFEEIQAAYYMVAATGVIVAAAYYIVNIRNANRTREAQLFMNLYNSINNKDFMKHAMEHVHRWEYLDYDDFEAKHGLRANPDENTYWHLEANFLETVGSLVNRGLIPVDLVDEWMGTWVLLHWEKYRPYIGELRKMRNDPLFMIGIERLYDRVKKYRQKTRSIHTRV